MISLKDYNPPQSNTPGVVIFILFWVGLALMIASIFLYNVVIIPDYIIVLLFVVPAVILTPYLNKVLPSKKVKGLWKIILVFGINIMAFGNIIVYGVLAVDYYGASDAPPTVKILPVVEYGYYTARHSTHRLLCADISYKNRIRTINFPEYNLNDSTLYRHVELQTTPGYLGFDVIRSKKLVK